jgi:hypothetical protein
MSILHNTTHEICRRTTLASTMVVFVLPKWAEFDTLTSHWNLFHDFPERTPLFTRLYVDDPTKQKVHLHG